MNEEQGLAQKQVAEQPTTEQVLQEIVRLLMSGTTPEELLDMGVPQELLQQAMMMVQQNQKPQVQSDGGLAMSVPR